MNSRISYIALVVWTAQAVSPPNMTDDTPWESPVSEDKDQTTLKIIIASSVFAGLLICAFMYCCWRYYQFRSIDDQSMARFQSSYNLEELGHDSCDLVEYASIPVTESQPGSPTNKKVSGSHSVITHNTDETLHPPKVRDSGSSGGGTLETSLLRSSFRSPPNSGSTGGRAGGSGSSVVSGDRLPPRSRNVTFVGDRVPTHDPNLLTLADKSLSSSLTRYGSHLSLKPPTSPATDNVLKTSIATPNKYD